MADAAERTTRAGAEAFQRNAEGAKKRGRVGAEAASRIAQRSRNTFKVFGLNGEAAKETVQQSAGNMQAVIEIVLLSRAVSRMSQANGRAFVQTRVEQNQDHLDQLRECRSSQDRVALQTR